jgi:hypothetical protein
MRRILFLAAPRQCFETPAYDAALRFLQERYPPPEHEVLSARDAWCSNSHWLETFREVLSGVTDMYIVTDQGYVGLGVYAEWEHLGDRVSCHAFTASGATMLVSRLEVAEQATLSLWALVLGPDEQVVC